MSVFVYVSYCLGLSSSGSFWYPPSSTQTAVPLQFALFELGRNPEVQERVRQQVRASWAEAGGDPYEALQGAPLLKGTIKEVLRWMTFKTHLCDY